MRPQAALALAVACAALAVAVVAVDIAWNVEATLERREGDAWVVVARSPPSADMDRYVPSCAGSLFRLTVTNELPWATTVPVQATSGGQPVPGGALAEWSLGAGESRSQEFTVPASALQGTDPGGKRVGSIEAWVGDDSLYACAGGA